MFDTEQITLGSTITLAKKMGMAMEPSLSMQAAAVLLGLGALGGLVMAGIRFSGTPRPPSWLAMLHGVFAAAGLTLLIYAAVTTGILRLAQFALGLLVLAALGGTAINLLYHSKMLPLPKSWIVGHALVAVSGYLLLLLSIFSLTQGT